MKNENLKTIGIFEDSEDADVQINDPIGRLMEAPSNTPSDVEARFLSMHSRKQADVQFAKLQNRPAGDAGTFHKTDNGAVMGNCATFLTSLC